MRVIKQGELKEKKGECERCGCVFSFNGNDIDYDLIETRDMVGHKRAYFVVCPTCEVKVLVATPDAEKLLENKE